MILCQVRGAENFRPGFKLRAPVGHQKRGIWRQAGRLHGEEKAVGIRRALLPPEDLHRGVSNHISGAMPHVKASRGGDNRAHALASGSAHGA